MRCSPRLSDAAPLPRSNMTVPKSNIWCAIASAFMPETARYGGDTIGIVSSSRHQPRDMIKTCEIRSAIGNSIDRIDTARRATDYD